jgi:hypothetical protein
MQEQGIDEKWLRQAKQYLERMTPESPALSVVDLYLRVLERRS